MRITKEPEIRKKEIIDAARHLFQRKGIAKTSINDIAKSIGVAKGLVYYYFSSKDELVETVLDEFVEDVDRGLKEIMANPSLNFYQKLGAILDLYFGTIREYPNIYHYNPRYPGLFALIRKKLSDTALIHARNLLQWGQDEGLINIQYPEYILKILIRGLGDLYMEGESDPKVYRVLIEQILGLEKGSLAGR